MALAGASALLEGALVLAVQPVRGRAVPVGEDVQLVPGVCAAASGTATPA
jgi:hypothetical protein